MKQVQLSTRDQPARQTCRFDGLPVFHMEFWDETGFVLNIRKNKVCRYMAINQ